MGRASEPDYDRGKRAPVSGSLNLGLYGITPRLPRVFHWP